MEKIKVFVIGDHMFSPSGVGTQLRYICEALIKSGKFTIRQFGGAIKHTDYRPTKTQEFGDDLIIFPVDGYGSPEAIRSFLRMERPDILLFQSDPRFFVWLWDMEDEIRPLIPMVYYGVWDNKPYPDFNRPFYLSNDYLVAISKLTYDVFEHLVPDIPKTYLSHAVPPDIFKPLAEEEVIKFRMETFRNANDPNSKADMNKVIFFFNSRNARRKQSSSLCWWFRDYLDVVGREKATLILHTDPKDPNGSDLEAIIHAQGITSGEVLFSREKLPSEMLSLIYNMSDCTVSIGDAEGMGLSVMESLNCGTPAVVTMTGGLQEQITDGKEYFGVGIKPASQCVIGSQDVPYIYEDRISKEDFIEAMLKITNMTRQERKALGLKGREYMLKNYNFSTFGERWVNLLLEVHDRFGSWNTRKNYKKWELRVF